MSFRLAYDEFMPNAYSIQKDLNDRLDGTVVRYKGRPFRCRIKLDDNGKAVLWLYTIHDLKSLNAEFKISPHDPHLDISIIESCYMNFKYNQKDFELPQRACWLTRTTAKHYKSGTYPAYTCVKTIDGRTSSEFNSETLMYSKEFEAATLGMYPELRSQLELFRKMKREEHEVAIDQRVALKRESIGLIKVYIDTRIVGWMDENDKIIITNDDRRWVIKRMLEPLGFKV